jgi:type VI secretion system secreted protein VgrG
MDVASGVELYTTVGGKDKFKIKARDNCGTEVSSKTVETRRIIYYKEIKMRGLTADCASSLTVLKNEFLQHGIKLISLGSSEMIPLKNIDASKSIETTAFLANMRAAYNATSTVIQDKSPYVMAIGYTSHQGIKKPNVPIMIENVTIGVGASDIVMPIDIKIPDPTDPTRLRKITIPYSLWKNMDTTDWFIQAGFQNTTTGALTPIPKSNITPITLIGHATDNCRSLNVKVSNLSTTTQIGKIIVRVNVVKGFTGGLSYPNTNVLCVCTKSWWVKKTDIKQNQILIHELGHSIGMVSDGGGVKPDKVSTHYGDSRALRSDSSRGHRGPHCYFGLSATLSSYHGVRGSSCVMFGATNGLSSFCINCAPAVKKMDLTKGWN